MKLFFVRHAQTEWNKIKKFQGQLDSRLTEEGIKQTISLKNEMYKYDFSQIFSSPLGRAVETSNLLKKETTNLILVDDLKEMSFGDIEGMKKDDIQIKYPKLLNNLWNNTLEYNPSYFNGETYEELEIRARRALDLIIKENKNSLIVTHGVILKVLFKIIKNKSWKDMEKEAFLHNTSITTINYEKGKFTIEDFSNIDHLKDFNLETFV
ncbi:histidine phosphatase family protein [Mycoplasma marinum]|uniref:Histidine phosphatase family protein n=1 Tax=Mycoplasma marinum TaxID=1937190 RepID=A0A4R0XS65_9MOLU|nr:histidine phosphatase family protein [Mycoplasma marinum]TCG11718.1 histidine phosphatase family protein [Mycoplasma marinum]